MDLKQEIIVEVSSGGATYHFGHNLLNVQLSYELYSPCLSVIIASNCIVHSTSAWMFDDWEKIKETQGTLA